MALCYNLKPELKEKIRNAFFNFEWEGTSLEGRVRERTAKRQFLEMNYKEYWEVIRKIDAANGVSYACE